MIKLCLDVIYHGEAHFGRDQSLFEHGPPWSTMSSLCFNVICHDQALFGRDLPL